MRRERVSEKDRVPRRLVVLCERSGNCRIAGSTGGGQWLVGGRRGEGENSFRVMELKAKSKDTRHYESSEAEVLVGIPGKDARAANWGKAGGARRGSENGGYRRGVVS